MGGRVGGGPGGGPGSGPGSGGPGSGGPGGLNEANRRTPTRMDGGDGQAPGILQRTDSAVTQKGRALGAGADETTQGGD